MPRPKNYHQIPKPSTSVSERNRLEPGALDEKTLSRLWRPRAGSLLEVMLSTISRVSLRLIDRVTGDAYSADELEAKILEAVGAGADPAWEDISGKPTSLAGYGITVANGDLAIAMTAGLRADLDSRVLESTFQYYINGLAGDIALKQDTLTNYSTISALTGYPASFTPSSHTHVSADVTDAVSGWGSNADAGKMLVMDSGGGIYPNFIECTKDGGTSVSGINFSGVGVFGTATSGIGISGSATTGKGLSATSSSGTYHATFGITGIDQSFIARVNGAYGWVRGAFTSRIEATGTLTANRTCTLPDINGAIAVCPTYADDTAAASGGLAIGDLYFTGTKFRVRTA